MLDAVPTPAAAPRPEPSSHLFQPTILREYDIRGVVGGTLGVADAQALGRAFAAVMLERGRRQAAVGRDGRLSSPTLAAALIEGLLESGVHVADVGLGPTPMLYHAAATLDVDAGLMVTGSHNPPDQNGFKLVLEGRPFFGADIRRLGEIAKAGRFPEGRGRATQSSHLEPYVADLLAAVDRDARPLRVAWDAGNGAAGEALQRLTAKLPGLHILLNETIDGRFPVHHPDPSEPQTLRQLQEAVVGLSCDFGVAFDGDGDRIGAVDGEGRIIAGDQLLALLAAETLEREPGGVVIADVKASQALFDEVERLGGRPLLWKTGHSHVKVKMAETGAPLAGEMSGHVFYRDNHGYDDALYAAVRLLGHVARSEKTLAALRDALPQPVNTPETRIPCADERKFEVVEEVRARLAGAGADVVSIDGVRVKTAEGWWLLRASNTQPALVARAEAADEAGLRRLMRALDDQLAASGVETRIQGS